jgi:hypothetical protein
MQNPAGSMTGGVFLCASVTGNFLAEERLIPVEHGENLFNRKVSRVKQNRYYNACSHADTLLYEAVSSLLRFVVKDNLFFCHANFPLKPSHGSHCIISRIVDCRGTGTVVWHQAAEKS